MAARTLVALSIGVHAGNAAAQASTPPVPAPAWRLDALYKADLLHARKPAIDAAVDFLDVALTLDAAALFGWDATTIRVEALSTHGGKPNHTLGSYGGISNLEVAANSARLYATWIARDITPAWSVLAGLYDLNSEFYATDASALLAHPAFGIGTEFGQSGRSGPSIFPDLSLGVRLRDHDANGFYAQAAVLDGVPGTPGHTGRTTVRLSRDDGALLVGEGGWQNAESGGHVGLGVWGYTRPATRLDGVGEARNRGAYALAQAVVAAGPIARTTGFVRFGIADGRLNPVDAAAEIGALVERPFGDAGPSAFTIGLTAARISASQRTLNGADGRTTARAEAAAEAGLRWRLGTHASLQPFVQRWWNAGGQDGARTTVLGLHFEATLKPSPP